MPPVGLGEVSPDRQARQRAQAAAARPLGEAGFRIGVWSSVACLRAGPALDESADQMPPRYWAPDIPSRAMAISTRPS